MCTLQLFHCCILPRDICGPILNLAYWRSAARVHHPCTNSLPCYPQRACAWTFPPPLPSKMEYPELLYVRRGRQTDSSRKCCHLTFVPIWSSMRAVTRSPPLVRTYTLVQQQSLVPSYDDSDSIWILQFVLRLWGYDHARRALNVSRLWLLASGGLFSCGHHQELYFSFFRHFKNMATLLHQGTMTFSQVVRSASMQMVLSRFDFLQSFRRSVNMQDGCSCDDMHYKILSSPVLLLGWTLWRSHEVPLRRTMLVQLFGRQVLKCTNFVSQLWLTCTYLVFALHRFHTPIHSLETFR